MSKKLFILLFISLLSFSFSAHEDDESQLGLLVVDELFKLPEPLKNGGATFNEALSERKSSRDFDNSKLLTLQQVSQALWTCDGPNRKDGHRTSPSAVAWYPLEIYVFLEEGIFYYNATEHALITKKKGDYRKLAGGQKFVADARMNFVILGDFEKKSSLDGKDDQKLKYFYIEAGHCTMNLGLYAAANKMKGVERGMIDDMIVDFLGLDTKRYKLGISFSLGF